MDVHSGDIGMESVWWDDDDDIEIVRPNIERHKLEIQFAWARIANTATWSDPYDWPRNSSNYFIALAQNIIQGGYANRVDWGLANAAGTDRFGWQAVRAAVLIVTDKFSASMEQILVDGLKRISQVEILTAFDKPIPETFFRCENLETRAQEWRTVHPRSRKGDFCETVKSFTELYHSCAAVLNDHRVPFPDCAEVFRCLHVLGVVSPEEVFAKDHGGPPSEWHNTDETNFQVLSWCERYCKRAMRNANEVPDDWDDIFLGIPTAPVNSPSGLLQAINEAFSPLSQSHETDWNNLTTPQSLLAKAIFRSCSSQARRLGIDVREVVPSENRELIHQLLDLRAAVEKRETVGVPVNIANPANEQSQFDNMDVAVQKQNSVDSISERESRLRDDQSLPDKSRTSPTRSSSSKKKTRSGPTAEQLMYVKLKEFPEALEWTAKEWAVNIGRAASTIVETDLWKTLSIGRERKRAELAIDRRKNRSRLHRDEHSSEY